MTATFPPGQWLKDRVFAQVVGSQLVYTACWEDPRVDRAALRIGAGDRVVVITSAGCNVLDYALDHPGHIYAVDINPRQNALLELKVAGVRNLDFETFFRLFGEGSIRNARRIYESSMRTELTTAARRFWDRHIDWFDAQRRRSFYFRGTAGAFAYLNALHIDHILRLREPVNELLNAESIEQQREIYDTRLRDRFWSPLKRAMLRGDLLLALSGVPQDQRRIVEEQYGGSIAAYLQETAERLIYDQSLADNYFWRVYLTGKFTRDCCPGYLQPENFARLKAGLVDGLSWHSMSLLDFLRQHDEPLTHFVLLDHMDWLQRRQRDVLSAQWQAITDRAAPNARIIWRSGAPNSDFVDRIEVTIGGRKRTLGDVLKYDSETAEQLQAIDRCHTYAGFFVATIS